MASQWGPERLEYTTGGPIASQLVTVRLRGSLALANLYADVGETAAAENPVMTEPDGDLVFFAKAGYYDLVFGNYEFPIMVGAPGGAVAQGYTHVQSVPAMEWVINHGLDFRPAGLRVVNNAGTPVDPGWNYDANADLILVSFSTPTAGAAWVS